MALDEFVVQYHLTDLQKQVDNHKSLADQYHTQNDNNISSLNNRVGTLETDGDEITGILNSLKTEIDTLKSNLTETNNELVKTKLINIKQDLVVRTLHNMTTFDAYDMHTDTFSDGENIDWENSIRAELLLDKQAIGKTRSSVVEVKQTMGESALLVSKNGTSDEAISQTFVLSKSKELHKVSIKVNTFSFDTWQPLHVRIRDANGGTILTETTLSPDKAIGNFVDVILPPYILNANVEYYIELATDDVYGYMIYVDTTDRYLAGTSFSLFNGTWTDNNHDIAFKVWCFPSADEDNATIYTVQKTLTSIPRTIVFEKEDVLQNGGINYFVTRDGGVNWKILQAGISTNLDDLPEGQNLIIKAQIEKDSYINGWGYVLTR